jgi:GMP synthase (glutamine-hydrolysing)
MKPVLILQHLSADGPAYLATWLRARACRSRCATPRPGRPTPIDLDAFSALAVLGGEMSANDPLPSLRQAETADPPGHGDAASPSSAIAWAGS